MRFIRSDLALRIVIAATLALSGVVHAYLYVHGYRHIPAIGPAFLVQASTFVALAILILTGGPGWLRIAAGVGSAGALLTFGMSRTTGLFGFIEVGWEPSPQAAMSVAAEIVTVVACVVWAFASERSGQGGATRVARTGTR
jgi:hypothetical protein